MTRLCECGCGEPSPLAKRTNRRWGHVKGEPLRFVPGHQSRVLRVGRHVEDRGHESPCLIWDGYLDRNGYAPHRAEWVRANGPVPRGLHVDHLCRQRDCVRVDHLELVTRAENVRRAAVANAPAEISPLRRARHELGLSQAAAARLVGLSPTGYRQWENGTRSSPADAVERLRSAA